MSQRVNNSNAFWGAIIPAAIVSSKEGEVLNLLGRFPQAALAYERALGLLRQREGARGRRAQRAARPLKFEAWDGPRHRKKEGERT
jgi:hypothetical protein